VAVPVLVIVRAEEAQALLIVPAEVRAQVIVRAVAQERETGLAAVPVLVIVQAAEVQALLIVPAEVRAQAIVLAEVELERGQALGAVVPQRIKSVIAARPRGLAQVPRAADLAVVVAETMPDRAATEAATAWAAAG